MSLRLVFWNCGVAPAQREGKRDIDEATRVVHASLKQGADMVALCESDDTVVSAISSALGTGIRAVSMAESAGRSRWDLALFLRSRRLRFARLKSAEGFDGGSFIRAARRVRISDKSGEASPFVLYLLHWRSRLHSSGHDYRTNASITLWARVRHDLENDNRVVVLGDFNDEPFDTPLSKHLKASRDPRHVLKSPTARLYNPTWWLSAPNPSDPWGRFGTYTHVGRTSGHYQLDQALTSAHYLNDTSGALPQARALSFISLGLPPPAIVDHVPLELTLP